MSYVVITPPAEEPVSLAELKAQTRVGFDRDDALLTMQAAAARMMFERETNRSLVSRQYRRTLDSFPYPRNVQPSPHFETVLGFTGEPIRLAYGPVLSVDLVQYLDFNGDAQTLAEGSDYLVDLSADVARISPAPYQPWPWAPRRFGAVTVEFTAGYGDAADVAAQAMLAKQAILMTAAYWYSTRETVLGGEGRFMALEMPMAAAAIMDSYKIPVLG